MRAATVTGAGRIELVEFAEPRPASDGIVVAVDYCGVCGTDVAAFRSGSTASPSLFGHEWTGRVERVGDAVTGFAEGDRVVVAVPPPCGRCRECLAGRPHTCRVVRAVTHGLDRDAPAHGGFAAAIAVDAGRVILADPRATAEDSALVEPAAVAHRAVVRSGIGLGDVAVVQGAGAIGLLVVQLARLAGARTTIVVEPSAWRRQMATDLGVDLTVPPGDAARQLVRSATDGAGADVTFECAGVPTALQSAVELTRRDGTVAMIGHTDEPATIQPAIWLGRDIHLVASVGYARWDFVRAMELIASGRVEVAALRTRTIGLGDLAATLSALARGGTDDVKVLVDPRDLTGGAGRSATTGPR